MQGARALGDCPGLGEPRGTLLAGMRARTQVQRQPRPPAQGEEAGQEPLGNELSFTPRQGFSFLSPKVAPTPAGTAGRQLLPAREPTYL